jgi:hypothetical protein
MFSSYIFCLKDSIRIRKLYLKNIILNLFKKITYKDNIKKIINQNKE